MRISILNKFQDLWPRKLSTKLALANIVILCITILGFSWYSASQQSEHKVQNNQKQLIIFTKNIAALAAKYLQLSEYDQLETKLYQLIQFPGVDNILVINNSRQYVLSVKTKPGQAVFTESIPEMPEIPAVGDGLIRVLQGHEEFWQSVQINQDTNKRVWVRVGYDTRMSNQIAIQIFKRSFSIAAIAILLSLFVLKRLLSKPMYELRRASEFAEYIDLSQGNQIELHTSSQEIEQLQRALNRTSEKLSYQEEAQRSSNLLLDAIREVQSQFMSESNFSVVFENLISKTVQLTKSEYGFFGEVLLDENDKPYLQMRGMSQQVMSRQTQEFCSTHDIKSLKFSNMNNLIGAVIQTKKPVIANDVSNDPRRGGLPTGHPNMTAFLGLPVFSNDRVIGVVGIANRVNGYDQGTVAYLQPLLNTCSHMIEGYRSEINRKQILDELKRNNSNLQTIMDSVSDGIITITQEGTISSVNAIAAVMFTYNTENMVGDDIAGYISGLQYRVGKLYVNGDQIYIQSCNEKIKWRMEGRHKDGHVFPIDISVSEYKHSTKQSYTITVRNLENDIGIYKIKEDLISTFDTELKDSLGSIRGSLMLLKGRVVGELSENVDDMIDSIYNSTERLIGLVHNVQDIYRIESGEIELHIRQIYIGSFIDRVLSSNQDVCRQYSISIKTAGDTEHTILGDEDRLLQIVRYLLLAAAKFCSPGGAVELSIQHGGVMLEFSVVGYAKQENANFMHQSLLMFSNLYNPTREFAKDQDFSLQLCRAVADHHGGKLGCESLDECSLWFYVQIPLYEHVEHASSM